MAEYWICLLICMGQCFIETPIYIRHGHELLPPGYTTAQFPPWRLRSQGSAENLGLEQPCQSRSVASMASCSLCAWHHFTAGLSPIQLRHSDTARAKDRHSSDLTARVRRSPQESLSPSFMGMPSSSTTPCWGCLRRRRRRCSRFVSTSEMRMCPSVTGLRPPSSTLKWLVKTCMEEKCSALFSTAPPNLHQTGQFQFALV